MTEKQYPCEVKPTRTHNAPCRCELPGSLHNRSWRAETAKPGEERIWC